MRTNFSSSNERNLCENVGGASESANFSNWDFNSRESYPELLDGLERTEFETTVSWIQRAIREKLYVIGDCVPRSYDADAETYQIAFELFPGCEKFLLNVKFPENYKISLSPSVAQRLSERRGADGFFAPIVASLKYEGGVLTFDQLSLIVETKDNKPLAISFLDELNAWRREKSLDYFKKENGEILVYGCDKSAEKIVVPQEIDGSVVTEIGMRAFSGSSKLKYLSIPSSVVKIDVSAFSACNALESIEVADDNRAFSSFKGALYSKDKKTLLYCPAKNCDVFKIDERVRKLDKYAFADCVNIKAIEVFDTLQEIADEAFLNFDYYDSLLVARQKRKTIRRKNEKKTFYNYIPFRIIRKRRFGSRRGGYVVRFAKKHGHSFTFIQNEEKKTTDALK